MTTITYAGGTAIVPDIAAVQSASLRSRSRVKSHEILDGPPVHTLRPASPSTGELRLVFDAAIAAADCYTAHQLPAVFTLTDPDVSVLNFRYVLQDGGEARLELDPDTQSTWVVVVPYQAVI
jgi:hypothetical protein